MRQDSLSEGWAIGTLSRSRITTLAGEIVVAEGVRVEAYPVSRYCASWNHHHGRVSAMYVGPYCGANGVIGSLRGISIGRVRTVEAEPCIARTKQG